VAEYQSFVARQYKCLQFDKDLIAERRIEISDLSGGLFELVNASLEIGIAIENKEGYSSTKVFPPEALTSGLYGHVNQHLGFAYSERFEGEIEPSFNKSIPARISCLGFAIIEQILKINSLCENSGQTSIFKPTSKAMMACAMISSKIVCGESEFYTLIDYLFFLLYEGSGEAKRLSPILNDSLLAPLWKVKHLRLSARHDIDHGLKNKIEKNRAKIRDTYMSLISLPLPIKQRDWQKAQLQIYIEIDLMLQKIIESIIDVI